MNTFWPVFSLWNLFTIFIKYTFIFNLLFAHFWVLSHVVCPWWWCFLCFVSFCFESLFNRTFILSTLCWALPAHVSASVLHHASPKLLYRGSFSYFMRASLEFHCFNSQQYIWAWLSHAFWQGLPAFFVTVFSYLQPLWRGSFCAVIRG